MFCKNGYFLKMTQCTFAQKVCRTCKLLTWISINFFESVSNSSKLQIVVENGFLVLTLITGSFISLLRLFYHLFYKLVRLCFIIIAINALTGVTAIELSEVCYLFQLRKLLHLSIRNYFSQQLTSSKEVP